MLLVRFPLQNGLENRLLILLPGNVQSENFAPPIRTERPLTVCMAREGTVPRTRVRGRLADALESIPNPVAKVQLDATG